MVCLVIRTYACVSRSYTGLSFLPCIGCHVGAREIPAHKTSKVFFPGTNSNYARRRRRRCGDVKGGEVDAGVGGEAAAVLVVSGAEALERTRTSLLSSSSLVLFVLSRAARPPLVSTPDTLRAHVVS